MYKRERTGYNRRAGVGGCRIKIVIINDSRSCCRRRSVFRQLNGGSTYCAEVYVAEVRGVACRKVVLIACSSSRSDDDIDDAGIAGESGDVDVENCGREASRPIDGGGE